MFGTRAFGVAVLAFALVASVSADTSCPKNMRGCNPPTFFSKIAHGATTNAVVYASKNFDTKMVGMKDGILAGHKAVIDFAGGVSTVNAFMFEPKGADADYKTVEDAICKESNCCTNQGCTTDKSYAMKDKAARESERGAGGAYYGGASKDECMCGHKVMLNKGLYYIPNESDQPSSVASIAAHEYFHAVQASIGDYPPGWLQEGGAVHIQCVLTSQLPKMDFGSGPMAMPYSMCMEMGGGRNGVMKNTIAYYKSAVGKKHGLKGGEDRCCGDSCGNAPKDLGQLDGALYYDAGAFAIAWAINHANSSSIDFVTSKSKGFWRAIVPYNGYDYSTGHPSSCPEGKGWKHAWTKFTGYKTMAEFYAAFDKFVGDIVATGDEASQITKLKAVLEKDDAIVTQAAKKVDTSSADFKMCPVLPTCQLDATCKAAAEKLNGAGATPPAAAKSSAAASPSDSAAGRSSVFGVVLATAAALLISAGL